MTQLAAQDLAERIRAILSFGPPWCEQKMFGSIAFMHDGHLLVGAMKDGALLVRVGKEGMEDGLAQPGAASMAMGARRMAGFIVVAGDIIEDEAVLAAWIERARAFVATLPSK